MGQLLHNYKKAIKGLGCMSIKVIGQGVCVGHYVKGLDIGVGLGFYVRLGVRLGFYIAPERFYMGFTRFLLQKCSRKTPQVSHTGKHF